MLLDKNKWMYGGAGLLAAVSVAFLLSGLPSVWLPTPTYLALVAFISGAVFESATKILWHSAFLALAVTPVAMITPALYLLVLKFWAKSKHFQKIVVTLIILFSALNFAHFLVSWEYGVKWQGLIYTKIVALENVIGFTIAFTISVVALIKNSRFLSFASNLFLFFLLSWCAFPYLGELP